MANFGCSGEDCDGVDRISKAKQGKISSIADVFATTTNFRSRYQENREVFEEQLMSDEEKKRQEKLKTRLAARGQNSMRNLPANRTASEQGPSNTGRIDRAVSKLKQKASLPNAEQKFLGRAAEGVPSPVESTKQPILPNSVDTSTAGATHKNHLSEITVLLDEGSNTELKKPNPSKSDSERNEERNEERRKKDGEKAKDKYRQRLLKDAEEGGFSITDQELNKRLDAYMKKREVRLILSIN